MLKKAIKAKNMHSFQVFEVDKLELRLAKVPDNNNLVVKINGLLEAPPNPLRANTSHYQSQVAFTRLAYSL